MRGVAGILYPDFFQANEQILPMLDVLKHRGKSGPNVQSFKNLELGLVGGSFVSNERKNIYVGLDGSIFNREDLCEELRVKGYKVPCKSDSELIVLAYEAWGIDCIQKLRGDFSFVILDQTKEKLILTRNRIGKKPFYWYQDNKYFIFASELKSLLATGLVPQTPALDAMMSYLYFGYMPQDMSPIEGVNKLLPGHYLELHLDGSKFIHQYWSLSSHLEQKTQESRQEILEHLDDLILEAVKVRMPEEEAVGCFVTGGLGSASIPYYLKKFVPEQRILPFSIAFEGENEEDAQIAAQVSDHLDLNLNSEVITKNNFLDDLVQIAWHLDEPQADPNVIGIWHLSRMASSRVKTIYSGMGCDEILAGHARYIPTEAREQMVRFRTPFTWLQNIMTPILQYLYKPLAYSFLKQTRTNPWQFEYLRYNALFPESEIAKASPRLKNLFDPEIFLHKFHKLFQMNSHVDSYLYFDIKTRLPDHYILMVERLTAAFNLEWRAPYLDRNLVEYTVSLPEEDILAAEGTAGFLRAILRNGLPQSVVDRPKVTRKFFLRSWLTSPEMREIFEMLLKGVLVEEGLISDTWLRKQLQELSESPDAFRWLWAILMLEIWHRLYINLPVRSDVPKMTVKELLESK